MKMLALKTASNETEIILLEDTNVNAKKLGNLVENSPEIYLNLLMIF